MLNRAEIKYIKEVHKSQKKSIKKAHQQELLQFQQAWNSYFRRLKDFQKAKLEQFRQQQDQEIEFIREKLRKKCSALRHPSKQIIDFEKEEEYHLNKGNITELMLVRREKKRLVFMCLSRWAVSGQKGRSWSANGHSSRDSSWNVCRRKSTRL